MNTWREYCLKNRYLVYWIPIVGVIAGLIGILETYILRTMRWLLYGTFNTDFLDAHAHAHPLRMLLVPIIAGCILGIVWGNLRARVQLISVEKALMGKKMPFIGTYVDALAQLFAVASGFSIGREGAPRQMSAAAIDKLPSQTLHDPEKRKLLLSCAAAAALASVYGAPWAGIPFALTLLYGSWTVASCIAAAGICWIAAATAWLVLGKKPILLITSLGSFPTHADHSFHYIWWLCILIPLAPFVAGFFTWITNRARVHSQGETASASRGILLMMAVGAVTGLIGLVLPQALGNGSSVLIYDLDRSTTALAAGWIISLSILIIKPLLTALSLRSGMAGGLLMPSAATGAAYGACLFFFLAFLGVIPASNEFFIIFSAVGAAMILGITQKSIAFASLCLIETTGMGVQWAAVLIIISLCGYMWNRALDKMKNKNTHHSKQNQK